MNQRMFAEDLTNQEMSNFPQPSSSLSRLDSATFPVFGKRLGQKNFEIVEEENKQEVDSQGFPVLQVHELSSY